MLFRSPQLEFNDIEQDANLLADSVIALFNAKLISINEARHLIGIDVSLDNKTITKSLAGDLKASDMKTFHPAAPGSPTGSQANEKKVSKTNKFTTTSGTQ